MQAVSALLWERWQRTGWGVLAAALAPLLGWIVGAAGSKTVGLLVSLSFWVLGTLLLTGVLLFGQSDLHNLNLGFPRRLYRFPVSTITMLAVYLGYGVAAISLPYLSFFGYAGVFGIYYQYWWTVFIILETTFIWLQTLAWLKGARGMFFFLIPSIAGVLTLLYLTAQYGLSLDIKLICIIMIVLCGGISFWNVSGDRRGAWLGTWRWISFLENRYGRKKTAAFRSPIQAQIWLETRQTGYLFPLSTLCFFGPVLVWRIVTMIFSHNVSPVALVTYQSIKSALGPVLIAAWLGGAIGFAVNHRNRKSGAVHFWLRRPVPTPVLSSARLKSMARSLAGTLGILAVILLGLLMRDWLAGTLVGKGEFLPLLLQNSPFLAAALLVLLALFGLGLVCWVLLVLPREVTLGIIGLEMAFAGVLVYFGGNSKSAFQFVGSDLVRWAGCVVAFGLMMVTLRILMLALRRKLISPKTIALMTGGLPIAAASFYALGLWTGMLNDWPGLQEVFYFFGLASLSFIPLGAVPLQIAKQRHG